MRVLAATVLLSLAACSNSSTGGSTDRPMAESGQSAQGERLYQTNCAACHDKGVGGAPTRAALEARSPAFIKAALTDGVMKAQGAALGPYEKAILADHLGSERAALNAPDGADCKAPLTLAGAPQWTRWGQNGGNARFQAKTAITPANVDTLELAWAFAFPGAQRARSQPAVTEEAIFTGSQSGRVYALDSATGCVHWRFDADAEVRNAPLLEDRDGAATLYFADFSATVYALDARTGKLRWKVSVRDHPDATITGSLAFHEGRLFVPMSSTEVLSAYDDAYRCCTFRGGVTALRAKDGARLWRWYSVPQPRDSGDGHALGPSGAPVWSTPTVDAKRGVIYVGTGENYSSPANENSDAIIALDIATGRKRWGFQATTGDAWNAACGRQPRRNCPREDGPDFDFGAPPLLVTAGDGRDLILAGQKSGAVFALDPDAAGRRLWQARAGMGGFNGGIHWGMASDGARLYAGVADTPGNRFASGPPRPGLHAFDLASGKPLWSSMLEPNCKELTFACITALSAPVTAAPGLIFAGAHNGRLLAYSASDGRVLWKVETNRAFKTVNGVEGKGGTIDGQGPVVAGDRVIVNSGYDKFGEIAGNVLLVYRLRGAGR